MDACLRARRERGGEKAVLRRYEQVCARLSGELGVPIDFLVCGREGRAWRAVKPHSGQRYRLLLKFWREMIGWLLRMASRPWRGQL